jgi:hypothetical protein
MDLAGQLVLGVTPKTSRNGTPMWDVALSDGNEWRTFDGGVAAFASSVVNTPGYVFDVAINGKYKNLEAIKDGSGALVAGQISNQPQQAAAPGAQVAAGTPLTGSVTGDDSDVVQRRIDFYGALKNAVPLVAAVYQGAGPEMLDQAFEDVKTLVGRIQVGAKAAERGLADLNGNPSVTPTEVAQAVNEAAGAVVVQPGESKVAW